MRGAAVNGQERRSMENNLIEAVAAGMVALSAVAVGIAFAVFVHRLDKRRRREAVEHQFSQAMQDLSEARSQMLAAGARTLGDDYAARGADALLSQYAEKVSLHLSRATDLLARHGIRGAPAEHLLLASTLAEQGRIADARPHYEIARQAARDDFAAAELGRMYGQAVYAMGNIDTGRRLIQRACDDFLGLSSTIGYDKAAMLAEFGETHRRLFELEWRNGEYGRAMASLSTIKSTRDNMSNPLQRARLTRMIAAIADQLKSSPQLRESGILSMVEERSLPTVARRA